MAAYRNLANLNRIRHFGQNAIYRAYRYAPDYPGLLYYDLTPQGTVERYRDGGQ